MSDAGSVARAMHLPLSAEDERAAIASVQAGGPGLEALVRSEALRLYFVARRYCKHKPHYPVEDGFQVALMAVGPVVLDFRLSEGHRLAAPLKTAARRAVMHAEGGYAPGRTLPKNFRTRASEREWLAGAHGFLPIVTDIRWPGRGDDGTAADECDALLAKLSPPVVKALHARFGFDGLERDWADLADHLGTTAKRAWDRVDHALTAARKAARTLDPLER